MKFKHLIKNLNFEHIKGNLDIEINSITINSKKAKKNSLFICIEGLNVDSHDFISSACQNGATAIVCSHDAYIPEDIAAIKVSDTREALSKIASNFYQNPSKKFNLIGITGTNGKTSSTYFMESVLNEINHKTGIIGTVEIRLNGEKFDINKAGIEMATSTTPDTIELQHLFYEMEKQNVSDVIMEVSSHALELKKVDDCDFDIAIFTNLTQDHLDFHKTMENYFNAKSKLFKMCKIGIINADDNYANKIINNSECDILTYSIEKESDIRATNIRYLMDKVLFDVNINGKINNFELNVPGRFSVYNALGVIGACIKMDIDIETIKKGLSKIKGVPGRIQNIPNNKGFNVIVDYAHTPDGVENIIKAVREFTKGKIITVFGCGGDRDKRKRPLMGEISAKLSDFSILTSDNPRSEEPKSIILDIETGVKPITDKYDIVVDRREAIYKAISMAKIGDSIIIAGKGHEDYEIFADKTIHFDDTEVAKEALEE